MIEEKVQKDLKNLLQESIKPLGGLKLFSSNCLGVHWHLRTHIEKIVNTQSILTIGKINFENGQKVFNFSQNDVLRWISNGIDDPTKLNLHAWLTLPSMEIIDFGYVTDSCCSSW